MTGSASRSGMCSPEWWLECRRPLAGRHFRLPNHLPLPTRRRAWEGEMICAVLELVFLMRRSED